LAAQPFSTRISGDESLAKRPMRRIIAPLTQMGAEIHAAHDGCPPLTLHGKKLTGIDYQMPVASAQVKSCVLLAGLYAAGETVVRESIATRDHTEIALRELGADVTIDVRVTRVRSGKEMAGRPLVVPGDLSSAAFFLVAALIVPNSNLIITNVGLNPTRTALLDVLRGMGADIKLLSIEQLNGEIVGNLQVRTSRLRGGVIEGPVTAAVIDEVPILAILGAVSENGISVRDAGELRVKESDRIQAIAENLARMGVGCQTSENSLDIRGGQKLRAAELQSLGDHRIAMAFAVAGLVADGPCAIHDAEAASVSFPEFYSLISEISKR
jgi:3-phosphoshikimate 1-carboxyvinyltransferase